MKFAVELVERDFGRLDILVNNAGIVLDRQRVTGVPVDVLRQTYETNVFGVVAVTKALLPLLRKSPSPRIVNVSSELGSHLRGGPRFAVAKCPLCRLQLVEVRAQLGDRGLRQRVA
jgi:NAD(P)-dependent dehydrogenase (short-subunit alcohol dehydrogenase family)